MTHAIDTPEQLRDVMHAEFTFSAQQFAAITAPLAPAVVIAGAGSGKTTVMAARVVWLVATGQVVEGIAVCQRAGQVVGQADIQDPVERVVDLPAVALADRA